MSVLAIVMSTFGSLGEMGMRISVKGFGLNILTLREHRPGDETMQFITSEHMFLRSSPESPMAHSEAPHFSSNQWISGSLCLYTDAYSFASQVVSRTKVYASSQQDLLIILGSRPLALCQFATGYA